MLNAEPSNLVLLKTYNTEFDEILIRFMDQNDRPLEIEVNLRLLVNKQKLRVIVKKREQENMSRDMDFYHLRKIYLTNT